MEQTSVGGTMYLSGQGIGEADMVRLAAFLRIGSERLRYRWQLAQEGHVDALLLGDESTVPMAVESVRSLRLLDSHGFEGEPGQLCRPLTFDALVEQLAWLEQLMSLPTVSDEVKDASPPEPPSVPAARASLVSEDRLYGIDRLPAAAMLGQDRHVSTVASLLTLRAVTFEALLRQSGLERADCQAALDKLHALGVLQVVGCAPAPARNRPRRRVPRAEPAPASGVLARLRDRFGLGS